MGGCYRSLKKKMKTSITSLSCLFYICTFTYMLTGGQLDIPCGSACCVDVVSVKGGGLGESLFWFADLLMCQVGRTGVEEQARPLPSHTPRGPTWLYLSSVFSKASFLPDQLSLLLEIRIVSRRQGWDLSSLYKLLWPAQSTLFLGKTIFPSVIHILEDYLKIEFQEAGAEKSLTKLFSSFTQLGQGRKSSSKFIISFLYFGCVHVCSHMCNMFEDYSWNFQEKEYFSDTRILVTIFFH